MIQPGSPDSMRHQHGSIDSAIKEDFIHALGGHIFLTNPEQLGSNAKALRGGCAAGDKPPQMMPLLPVVGCPVGRDQGDDGGMLRILALPPCSHQCRYIGTCPITHFFGRLQNLFTRRPCYFGGIVQCQRYCRMTDTEVLGDVLKGNVHRLFSKGHFIDKVELLSNYCHRSTVNYSDQSKVILWLPLVRIRFVWPSGYSRVAVVLGGTVASRITVFPDFLHALDAAP